MSVTGLTEVAVAEFEKGIIFGDVAQPKQSVYAQSVTQNYQVGTELIYGDGRHYRYARCGAGSISKALMQQGAVDDADLFEQDQTGNYPVVGQTKIVVEIGTGITIGGNLNDLAGGTLVVDKGSGIGDTYNILASKLGSTDTNMALIIDSPIRTTWTTSSEITITPNLHMLTIVQVEPATAIPCGVPNIDVTTTNYYWCQTKGPVGLIVDTTETVVIGDMVGAPATQTTAGACGIWVTLTKSWGEVMTVGTTLAEPTTIYLDLH